MHATREDTSPEPIEGGYLFSLALLLRTGHDAGRARYFQSLGYHVPELAMS
jgi:hypothetical protein